MRKKVMSLILVFMMCLSLSIPAFASNVSTDVVFSSTPSESDMRLIDHCQEDEEVVAWIIDPEGNKTFVEPIANMNTRSFINGQVLWTFVKYNENVTKSNDYQHFISSVGLRNRGPDPVPLKYIQTESNQNQWTVTGKVEAEAEFKVAMLAKLKATFGLNIAASKTTYSSTEVEFTLSIPPGKTGKISKYYAGKYSGGQGVWHGENIISGADAGYYYELGSAWAIATNETNFDYEVK